MRTERIADTNLRFRRNGAGDAALVFVHGFLDDQYAWDGVIAELGQQDVETVQLDLAGMGERTDEDGPFTYDRFASEAGAVADALDKPVVFVAQSMAGPVVELAAATRPERTLGLVLVDPVPLAGTRLPRRSSSRSARSAETRKRSGPCGSSSVLVSAGPTSTGWWLSAGGSGPTWCALWRTAGTTATLTGRSRAGIRARCW
jgi:pimeloyl-ACP methyl ester carboxylesterase